MPLPQCSYVVYVDDSGNEKVGSLWTGLAIPLDLWTEYLGRWLGFRSSLYNKHAIPATFELHAQALGLRSPRASNSRASPNESWLPASMVA